MNGMTSEERFNKIEQNLVLITESQIRLMETVNGLAASVSQYVDAAQSRLAQIEANLDGLIRIITAEHKNGKSHN
jgi:hypothetical protein